MTLFKKSTKINLFCRFLNNSLKTISIFGYGKTRCSKDSEDVTP